MITFNLDDLFEATPNECEQGPRTSLRSRSWPDAMRETETLLTELLLADDHDFVILHVHSRRNRFVQARRTPAGGLFVECVGPEFTAREPYTLVDFDHLVRLGWRPARIGFETPNYWREADAGWFYAQPMLADLMIRTLIDVHGALCPGDIVVRKGKF